MEKSPFNRLSRELRDKIYEYAVVHESGIKITHRRSLKSKTASKVARKSSGSKNSTLALAKTCK
jgi:hypothetical protein